MPETDTPLVVTTESEQFLTNGYLVADRPGGRGVLVDSNGVLQPLLDAAAEHDVTIEKLILTHHHHDHAISVREDAAAAGGVPVVASAKTAELIDAAVDEHAEDHDVLEVGDLRIEVRHTPGHCTDHHALVVTVAEQAGPPILFSADALFKGTVGGTVMGGPDGFAELKQTLTGTFGELPDETDVRPGHREPTTLGAERADNPFLRIWAGTDPEGGERARVEGIRDELDGDVTLVLWAPDYDGGNKGWIRTDDGVDAIVGGSKVQRG